MIGLSDDANLHSIDQRQIEALPTKRTPIDLAVRLSLSVIDRPASLTSPDTHVLLEIRHILPVWPIGQSELRSPDPLPSLLVSLLLIRQCELHLRTSLLPALIL